MGTIQNTQPQTQKNATRVIGLMSGTSVDGIDAALVDISGNDLDIKVELIAGETYPYPVELREKILAVCAGENLSMADFAELDDNIARAFAEAAREIQLGYEGATLVGSHGQTVYHRPASKGVGNKQLAIASEKKSVVQCLEPTIEVNMGYSLQLGRGSLIANLTGITTVSNFRAADIAVGGQGAPMVPKIDAALLSHPQEMRCIQNIGGIGNVTYLPARGGDWLEEILGWDTGPGNSLLDLAVTHLTNGAKTFDKDGEWAASGVPCQSLVKQWLQQDYFHLLPPKSTGRELFGVSYLHECLADASAYELSPADFLATLTELTAASIVQSYRDFLPKMPHRVLLCGGGCRNLYLKHRLEALLETSIVQTTDDLGLNGDFKEAIAFAVLAYWRKIGVPGNLPYTTGARHEVLLGEVNTPGF